MRTKYRVKVTYHATRWYPWVAWCEGCATSPLYTRELRIAHDHATSHAARCEDLHRRNWQAACPSCKAYGSVARACPKCQGYGWVKEVDA